MILTRACLLLKAHLDFVCNITHCDELWDNYSSTGHRVALVEVEVGAGPALVGFGSVGEGPARLLAPVRLLSGTRAISTTGWTVLFPPMVKLSICCHIRVATWALAPLFVTKMLVSTALIINQNGAWNPKKVAVTACTTKLRTMEEFRVKNGILLTMNPTEHTGWIIVDAGRLMKAQISAVTMARTVAPLLQRKKVGLKRT